MCTLSFLPLPDGGYLLAGNRDESRRRGPAHPPQVLRRAGRRLLAPIDSDAGGSWVAVDEQGRCLAILNGDQPPARAPAPDAPSRGLLLLDLMDDPSADAVAATLTERRRAGRLREKPFQLVIAAPGSDRRPAHLERLTWDGEQLARSPEQGPTLAVSSTFAPDAVARARQQAFESLRATAHRDLPLADLRQAQRHFHRSHAPAAPQGDAFSVCMHRTDASTVSSTQLLVAPACIEMSYQPGQPCAGAATTESRLR